MASSLRTSAPPPRGAEHGSGAIRIPIPTRRPGEYVPFRDLTRDLSQLSSMCQGIARMVALVGGEKDTSSLRRTIHMLMAETQSRLAPLDACVRESSKREMDEAAARECYGINSKSRGKLPADHPAAAAVASMRAGGTRSASASNVGAFAAAASGPSGARGAEGPPIDSSSLKRGWEKLTADYEALRKSFATTQRSFKSRVADVPVPPGDARAGTADAKGEGFTHGPMGGSLDNPGLLHTDPRAPRRKSEEELRMQAAVARHDEVALVETLALERERDIDAILSDAIEVKDIFKDLGILVSLQGDRLKVIDKNVTEAKAATVAGVKQIHAADRYDKAASCAIM